MFQIAQKSLAKINYNTEFIWQSNDNKGTENISLLHSLGFILVVSIILFQMHESVRSKLLVKF